MPFVHGKNATIWVWDAGGTCRNLSGDKNSITLAWDKNNPETTTFGKVATQRIAGLQDATLSGAGIWNSDDTTGIDDVFSGLMAASAPTLVQFSPAGAYSGCAVFSACYQLSKYDVQGPFNGVAAVSWEFQLGVGQLNAFKAFEAYVDRISSALSDHILAHWPFNDTSGTTVLDISGNGRSGVSTNATLNQPGHFNVTSTYFSGSGGVANYSAGLAADFNPNLGSMTIWAKLDSWTTTQYLWSLGADISNRINLLASAGGVTTRVFAGGNSDPVIQGPTLAGHVEFVPITVTWNKAGNRLRLYIRGTQYGSDVALPGTWSGTMGNQWTALGAAESGYTGSMVQGWLQNAILTDSEPSIEQIGALHGFSDHRNVLAVGDSKTVGVLNDTEYGKGYLPRMNDGLMHFIESPTRIAAGGVSVADVRTTIDASLAAATGTPDYIFINLGVNDIVVGLDEATFKSNYDYIIAALHAKYPLAIIRLMQVWQTATDRSVMDGWIGDLAAAHAYTGLWGDERTFLPDNNSDGTHPTIAGYQIMADLARQSIGF